VFHQKFGNGNVTHIDGNKLTIAFDRAGESAWWTHSSSGFDGNSTRLFNKAFALQPKRLGVRDNIAVAIIAPKAQCARAFAVYSRR